MTRQERSVKQILQYITDLFSDTSVGSDITENLLLDIREDIDCKLACLKEQIRRGE